MALRDLSTKMKAGATIAGLGALVAAKFYGVHLYQKYKEGQHRKNFGYRIGPKTFQGLPKARQQGILSYRRQSYRDLENEYKRQNPRKPRLGL